MTSPSRKFALSLLVVPALGLAACGGGKSDKDKITDIVKDGAKNPSSICDNLADKPLKQLGGKDKCKELAKKQPSSGDADVKSVKIDGDKATVKVSDKDGNTTIAFVKQDGDWKVDSTN